jgi:hypothetical protein
MLERTGKHIGIVAADLRAELDKGTSKAEIMKMWKIKKSELEAALVRYNIVVKPKKAAPTENVADA